MKRHLSILLFPILILMAGCDKISPDQYTVPTGGVSTGGSTGSDWESGIAHGVLVEKYTGPHCVNCPDADVTLDAMHEQFGDKLVVISINHPDGQGEPYPNQPDMRTAVGTAWDRYFGVNTIPAAFLNRNKGTQYSGSMDNIGGDIAAALATDPRISVAIPTVDIAGDTLHIGVRVDVFRPVDAVTLTLALTEDSLAYRQSTPQGIVSNYVHNHMLRDVVTDTWGDDIPLNGYAGESKIKTYTYILTDNTVQLRNSHLVAIICDKATREVLNCSQTDLKAFLPNE